MAKKKQTNKEESFTNEFERERFWHSSSHLLAHAVKNLFPDVKLGIGPATDEGFYYDFEKKEPFKKEDLRQIEKEMRKLALQNLKLKKTELPKKDGIKKCKDLKEPLKEELAKEREDENLSFYQQGDFIDLCKGPHIESTGKIKAIKLLKVSGAYWKADQSKQQLQRIYGISFPSQKLLDEYITKKVEAQKRDHRKIGKAMDLFSFDEEAPGFVFYHRNGTLLKNALIDFWRDEHHKAGYSEISTPIILKKTLWEQSGHWYKYKDNMYFLKIDDQEYAVKPMNCPGGLLIYKKNVHSYKELPMRIGEIGLVHRHELSGVISGLFRVRAFTQDDAHIYTTPDQVTKEVEGVMKLTDKIYKTFGFEYHVELSTMPESDIVPEETARKAEHSLKTALDNLKVKYKISPGEGAFYGPKIDFHIKDAIGRSWQCGTVQVDFLMPERFDLKYMGKDSKYYRPVMIHRAIYGSIERFLGILLEHFAGKLPLWISPVQAVVLTVADRFKPYAETIYKKLNEKGLKVETDFRDESIPYKVRNAQLRKIPLIIIVGEKEEGSKVLSVRTLDGKVKFGLKLDDFLKKVLKNIKDKETTINF